MFFEKKIINKLIMKKKFTIVLVATTASTINSFMLNNIKELNNHYNLIIFCNNAISLKRLVPKNILLKNINFKRKPNLVTDFITFLILLYFLFKIKPNLSISLTPQAGFITAISSAIARTTFRIHWFTGQFWVTKKGFVRIFYRFLDKIIFNLSHHVLVDSFSQKKFLISNNVISKKNSTVLLHGSVGGVNLKKFRYSKKIRNFLRKKLKIPKNDFIFLYLGRINKDKGIIELIEAFNKIEKLNRVFLILVGPIEDEGLKKLIKKQIKVIYKEHTSTPEKWFSVADILCLPSYREGFGSVIIEAGACNLPSLGSKIYGITDAIVENQTGFFHKVGNISDIKKKMSFVIKNRKLLKKYGLRSRIRVKKKFEQNLVSQKLLKFVNSKMN